MAKQNDIIIAGDIGGTNTNLALVEHAEGSYKVLLEHHYKTQEEKSLAEPFARFIEESAEKFPNLTPSICCISGAGPVVNNTITLTNARWGIDAPAITKQFGIPTIVINDFTAVSYGISLLDPEDTKAVTKLLHCDGTWTKPDPNGLMLAIGAGTGLGVGFVVKIGDNLRAFPSEGGHVVLPVYDDESRLFQEWLSKKFNFVAGAEAGISGIGIGAIFDFFLATYSKELSPLMHSIAKLSPEARPEKISLEADNDPWCGRIMDMFIKLYARIVADMAVTFIPTGGIFLAGGIAAKNEERFIAKHRFMQMFERSYRDHTAGILKRTPVMIAKNYDISIYGAARAAIALRA